MDIEIANKKRCTKCKSFKVIEDFHWLPSKNNYRAACKDCHNRINAEAREKLKGKKYKNCSKCKRYLSVDKFRFRSGKDNHLLNSQCNDCRREQHKDWCAKNPKRVEQYRKADEWTLYKRCQKRNISPDDLFKAIEAQDNKCPVCNKELGEITETAIDHNHETGKFRGVLHKECNRGLGLLKDNPETLRRAAEYLESRGYYGE